jgi:uncharacterized protein (TIGR02270 family)
VPADRLIATAAPLPNIIAQHADDAAILYSIRSRLVAAPHVKLKHIDRFDQRLSAHLDGLTVAGGSAWSALNSMLAPASPGSIFAAAVMAIESRSMTDLNRLYALAEALPEIQAGLLAAFGWVHQTKLRGIVNALLSSETTFLRFLGIAACAMHRVDAGKARDAVLEDHASPPALLARTLRAAGESGLRELLPACLRIVSAESEECQFWACWSSVLLGNRGVGLERLLAFGRTAGPFQAQALSLSIQALNQADAHHLLRELAVDPANLPSLIRASGVAGDSAYIPWLLRHMEEEKTARLAGESFALMTGVDLAAQKLDRTRAGLPDKGPNDDPQDANVEMDDDDDLPWPDPERTSRWWDANGGRFNAGTRHFLGAPLTRENCIRALKEGFQRQRILAAHYLCLLEPGTVLFEWRAPSHRQQRLLAGMD